MVTENLECRPPNLLVYGGQDIPDYLTSGTTHNRMHFLGNHKLLNLESSVTNSNGQNECKFRHLCDEDICHFMFISVQNVPEESSWKICEVLFDWKIKWKFQLTFPRIDESISTMDVSLASKPKFLHFHKFFLGEIGQIEGWHPLHGWHPL